MSRTKRIYNRVRKHMTYFLGEPWYHPYIEWCCGNCKACKDVMKSRREKLNKRLEFKRILKEELK